MECLKQVVKSKQMESFFCLPSSFLDYEELEIIIMPVNSKKLATNRERAEKDIEIINANAERLNNEAEENLLFQDIL
jgi:hypothetical protein